MTLLESIADKVAKKMERCVWMTIPQREEIRKLMVDEFSPVCVEQATFHFSEPDGLKNAEQAQRILALLKERRSRGATNVELAAIALKYTSRVSELRQAPHYYKIRCERGEGRVMHYFLNPEDW
jgi:hypothetical protein